MLKSLKPITILMADDSEDDRLLTRLALEQSLVANELYEVENGQELMDYLHRRGPFAAPASSPHPGLVLLDLNMPLKNGFEALQEIRADVRLRRLPVIVLTTSQAEEDIVRSYDLGINSFISKPVTFEALVEIMRTLGKYWIEIVSIPGPDEEE